MLLVLYFETQDRDTIFAFTAKDLVILSLELINTAEYTACFDHVNDRTAHGERIRLLLLLWLLVS